MFDVVLIVSVIISLVQNIKPYVQNKYLPLVSLVLGILSGIAFLPDQAITEKIMVGICIGLAASGTFDISKLVTK